MKSTPQARLPRAGLAIAVERWLLPAALATLAVLAALLLSRRLAGSLTLPLPAAAVVALGGVILTLRYATHVGAIASGWPVWRHALVAALGLSIWAALWLPQTSVAAMLLWGGALLAVESVCWRQVSAGLVNVPAALFSDDDVAVIEDEFNPNLISQIERTRQPDGGEIISGTLAANFVIGQRTTDVHVAFCPPLAGVPQVEAETMDGPAARVKVAQVVPGGARLEVRLDTPASEPTRVVVQVLATAGAA